MRPPMSREALRGTTHTGVRAWVYDQFWTSMPWHPEDSKGRWASQIQYNTTTRYGVPVTSVRKRGRRSQDYLTGLRGTGTRTLSNKGRHGEPERPPFGTDTREKWPGS